MLLQYTISKTIEAINRREIPICIVSKFIESRAINQLVILPARANSGVINQFVMTPLLLAFRLVSLSAFKAYCVDVDQITELHLRRGIEKITPLERPRQPDIERSHPGSVRRREGRLHTVPMAV